MAISSTTIAISRMPLVPEAAIEIAGEARANAGFRTEKLSTCAVDERLLTFRLKTPPASLQSERASSTMPGAATPSLVAVTSSGCVQGVASCSPDTVIRMSETSTFVRRKSDRELTALESGELCEIILVVNTWSRAERSGPPGDLKENLFTGIKRSHG